jgi:hypothetical protein
MASNIPNPRVPVVSPDGFISPDWYRFLAQFHDAFMAFSAKSATPAAETLTAIAAAAVTTPATGSVTLFVDSADGQLKRKDSTGTVTAIG